jgi:DNA-binding NarL/FixJ family response regulator
MFAAVPEPFVGAKRKHQTMEAVLQKRRRVVELRDQGKTLAQISEEMKLSIGAVRNHLAKASAPASSASDQPLAVGENDG